MAFFDLPTKRVNELKKGDLFLFAGAVRRVSRFDKKFLYYGSKQVIEGKMRNWKVTGTITRDSKMIVLIMVQC